MREGAIAPYFSSCKPEFLLWGERAVRRHGSRENSARSRNPWPYAPETPAQIAGGGSKNARKHHRGCPGVRRGRFAYGRPL